MNSDVFHILVMAVMTRADYPPGQDLVRMCQYNSAARHRSYNARFNTLQIDFNLCTHYVFAYANVDRVGKTIRAADPADEGSNGQYWFFNINKYAKKNIKTLLSVGGPGVDNHDAFNEIVREDRHIQTFAENAVKFVRQQRFDGLEIDWQAATNAERVVTLLKTLKNALLQESIDSGLAALLLTIKCPGLITYAQEGFASKLIAWYADYLLLTTYDMVLPGTTYATFSSPLYGMKGVQPDISVNSTVRYYEKVGIPFKKMLLGIRAAGRYSRLTLRWADTPGSSIRREVVCGFIHNLPSTMTYPEVCLMRAFGRITFDEDQKVPYLVFDDFWVGYENKESIGYKMRWLISLGIAGIMFPGLDEDDFSGTICGEGKHPLLSYIKTESIKPTTMMTTPQPPIIPGQTFPGTGALQSTATTHRSVISTRKLSSQDTDDVFTNPYLMGLVMVLGSAALLLPIIIWLRATRSQNSGE